MSFHPNAAHRPLLHPDAPAACYGRQANPMDALCRRCPVLADCASLLLARHNANHASLDDAWVPEGYEVPQASRREQVYLPERVALTEQRRAEITATLTAYRQGYDRAVGTAYVDLLYRAGPLLTEAKKAMAPEEYDLFVEEVIGYGRSLAWAIEKAYRVLPEAEYRPMLERVGRVDAIYQLMMTEDPIAWLTATHYVPRIKKALSIFEMTTADMRQARAYEKKLHEASQAADVGNAQAKASAENPKLATPDAGTLIAVLRSADILVDGWERVKHNVPKVQPNEEQVAEIRAYIKHFDAMKADLVTMLGTVGATAEGDAVPAPFAPSGT